MGENKGLYVVNLRFHGKSILKGSRSQALLTLTTNRDAALEQYLSAAKALSEGRYLIQINSDKTIKFKII